MRKEYRKQVAECVRLAEQANDLIAKLTYVGLARAWIGLAALADEHAHEDYKMPQASSHRVAHEPSPTANIRAGRVLFFCGVI
jgi:hypothetical protein